MIEVNNTTKREINERFLKKIAQRVLKAEKSRESNLSVAIVGAKRSQELNKRYRGKDNVANVLSFPVGKESIPSEVEGYLGEIVLCPQKNRERCEKIWYTISASPSFNAYSWYVALTWIFAFIYGKKGKTL